MRGTLQPMQIAERAGVQARDAARRSGVEVVPITEIGAMHEASALFDEVWGTNGENVQIPPELMRALVHTGNYAAGAYAGGELRGAIVGVLGRGGSGDGEIFLHSHILGVRAACRGSNIGFALKQHQRAWALERGIRKVTWTFDPLVRRNAHFNVQKLGADASDYYESFYGVMRDEINAGDESDRLYIVWRLDDERADEAATSRPAEPQVADLVGGGAVVALAEDATTDTDLAGAGTVLCATPVDIVTLRKDSPDEARRWRRGLRATLGAAMHAGFRVVGFARSGWYVLERSVRDGDDRA